MLGNCALMGASSTEEYSRDASPPLEVAFSTEKYPARRVPSILVSISTRHLQYFFYRLDIYFDRLGLICNHLCPCAFYAG